jgi:hypothetical protein
MENPIKYYGKSHQIQGNPIKSDGTPMNSPGSFVVIEFRAQDAEFTTNGDTHEVRGPTQWEKMGIS